MHCASAIIDVFWAAESCEPRRWGRPAAIVLWQADQAARNAGVCMLIVEGIEMSPIMFAGPAALATGSGKSGTPCARMHVEKASS